MWAACARAPSSASTDGATSEGTGPGGSTSSSADGAGTAADGSTTNTSASTSTGVAPDPCEPLAATLSQAAESFVDVHGVPGVTMAVSTPQCPSVAAAAGLANVGDRVPMEVSHHLGMGSNTKSFVAALLLLLQEDGALDLDDPLAEHLPALEVPGADVITIRQLLDHTSGVPEFQNNAEFRSALLADPGRVWEPEELVAYGVALGSAFAPGRGWGYSNTNYVLAGMVAEARTGQSIAVAIRQRVLQPAELDDTVFGGEERVVGELAHGYYLGMDVTGLVHPSSAWASGAMVTTATDLAAWMDALLRGPLLGETSKVELVDWIPTGGTPIAHYGLGLFLYDLPAGTVVAHNGSVATGYRAAMGYRFDTDDIAVGMFNVVDDTDPLLVVDAALAAIDEAAD